VCQEVSDVVFEDGDDGVISVELESFWGDGISVSRDVETSPAEEVTKEC